MSKWRPNKDGCIYVIPDIHGASKSLNIILKRITPLRKVDKIIFLGDYIDRNVDSHKVIQTILDLKNKYKDQVICLMGNHELMMLYGLGLIPSSSKYFADNQLDMWLMNGGRETIYGYLDKSGLNNESFKSDDLYVFMSNVNAMKSVIPKDHVEFMINLLPYYEYENFTFVHGGCHPDKSISDYDMDTLCWDRSLVKLVETLTNRGLPLNWNKIIITGHSTRSKPVIRDKYMMLDIGSRRQLLVVEAYTREAFVAKYNKGRLVKYEIKTSQPKKSLFRRVDDK